MKNQRKTTVNCLVKGDVLLDKGKRFVVDAITFSRMRKREGSGTAVKVEVHRPGERSSFQRRYPNGHWVAVESP